MLLVELEYPRDWNIEWEERFKIWPICLFVRLHQCCVFLEENSWVLQGLPKLTQEFWGSARN